MDFKAVMPILGFDTVSNLTLEPIDDIFYRLANSEGEAPSFTLIQPGALREDYIFDLPKSAAEKLELENAEDAMVLNIVIIDTPLENSHVNFIAPLVFNTKNGTMAQVVLDSVKYPDYGLADPLKAFFKAAENAS
ncbi:flagellar assembly protein FliW [Hydrogenimonas cancrithermarum]|uniref:Flagellar assembly factor FliW n=1 Tax=Hydrogenimonas cancrithermarum TaxID=2993563 RepID=A0ABN6WWJ6_9BACT|nr:flagellar assembly protein FliW [Hydrogenimonas cancrithermarum]BDY13506.1 flagellar assembly factor FliW 2 [Hydrogenimonas cancrithermarum]